MTPNDVMREVAAIGNTTVNDIEENVFYAAINSAFERANKIRPILKSSYLYNYSLPFAEQSNKAQDVTANKAVSLGGKNVAAIYLNTAGACQIVITAGQKSKVITTFGAHQEHRYIVKEICGNDTCDVDITITTNGIAVLIAYALWQGKYNDNADDIPSTSIYNTYSLLSLASDLQTLKAIYKVDEQSEQVLEVTDYIVVSERELWILKNKEGKYRLEYAPRCKRLTRDNADQEIGTDQDVTRLIVLLTAYWIWYEDLNEIAQNCYAQYMQLAAEIKNENRAAADPQPKNVYGW